MWRVEVTDKQVYYCVDDEYGLLNSYFMPVCSIVKTITRGAVDDNSASGLPRYRGLIVLAATNRHEINV